MRSVDLEFVEYVIAILFTPILIVSYHLQSDESNR